MADIFRNISNMHIYIINLKRRTDRRKIMEYKIKKYNISNYSFFDAVDGYLPKYDNLYDLCHAKPNNLLTSRGAFGLLLTYIELLKDAHFNHYDKILILEDDISFHKNIYSMIDIYTDMINSLDNTILWIGANQNRFDPVQMQEINKINESKTNAYYNVANKIYTYGTYSIILDKKAIFNLSKVINYKNILNFQPIDLMMNYEIRANNIKGCVLYPFLVLPDVTESDNMGARDQIDFCTIRKYVISDYDYISMKKINRFKELVQSSQVSIKEIELKFNSNDEIYILFNEVLEFVKNIDDIKLIL
jgi:GR25 family glycosyltransferase involved in LPS biosynthesis